MIDKTVCAEICAILDWLGDEYIDKIPLSLYKFIDDNRGEIKLIVDSKSIGELKIQEDTKSFIAYMNIQYWCTLEEKKEWIKILDDNEREYQKEIHKKYSVENIFKEEKKDEDVEDTINKKNMLIIKNEESVIKKIFNKIKKIFQR